MRLTFIRFRLVVKEAFGCLKTISNELIYYYVRNGGNVQKTIIGQDCRRKLLHNFRLISEIKVKGSVPLTGLMKQGHANAVERKVEKIYCNSYSHVGLKIAGDPITKRTSDVNKY